LVKSTKLSESCVNFPLLVHDGAFPPSSAPIDTVLDHAAFLNHLECRGGEAPVSGKKEE
jgi:hypothetical protein